MIAEGQIGELFRIHAICGGGDLKDNATHTVDLYAIYIRGSSRELGDRSNRTDRHAD